jgi:hypothetical membrane protein
MHFCKKSFSWSQVIIVYWRDASFGLRFLIFCGIAAGISRSGYLLVLGAMTPGYSHLANFNSELSAREATYQDAATLSLYVVGALIFLFSVGLARWTRSSNVGLWGSLVLAVTGLAFVLIGVFPCDPGCSLLDPTPTMKAHLLAGFAGMSLQAIAIVIFCFYGVGPGEDPRIGKVSRPLGALAVISVAWLFSAYAQLLPDPVIAQKAWTLVSDIWLVSCAIVVVRTGRKPPTAGFA